MCKRILSIILVIASLFGVTANSKIADARENYENFISYKRNIVFTNNYNNVKGGFVVINMKKTTKKKIAAVVSDNKKIAEIEEYALNKHGFWAIFLKNGTVNFKITVEGGKVYKCRCTIVKYENPLKKLKVGGKDYAKKFNKADEIYNIFPKGKIYVTPKKNWKIVSMVNYKGDDAKKIKNGDYVTVQNGMELVLKNKKTGVKQWLNFGGWNV